MKQISYSLIGVIHTPFKDFTGMPIQPSGASGIGGTVEVDPAYCEGLEDLEGFSHIYLLYHFHVSRGYALKIKPFMDDTVRGVFATRAPRRPNPVGLSIVGLVRIEGCTLFIQDVDVLDGTPLLDIKPYVPEFDAPEATRTGWLSRKSSGAKEAKSDNRFVRS
jgi:tRNA-Thr(GGU) m(6)t(6)A37 methyltransferase TsaA